MNKKVVKPWGYELWLELNDKYCLKIININANHRTSLQYHKKKLETTYITKGKIELLLEDDKGNLEKTILPEGSYYTTQVGRKHRVYAIEDSLLLEASTPEVEDIIRIEDDYLRPNGKIDSEHRNS